MRLQSWLWLLLSGIGLVAQVYASEITHQREKMVLYLIYDVFCDVLGAEDQKMIFPQDPSHPWPRSRNLGARTADKRLSYPEFMARISGASMTPDSIKWDIRSPREAGIQDALADLKSHRMAGGSISVPDVAPALVGWEPPAADRNREDFVELYERALKKFHTYGRSEVLVNVVGAERRALVSQLSGEIYNLRREETWNFIAGRFKGLGIDVVAPLTDSAVRGGPKYSKVNVAATLAQYTDSDGKLTGALAKEFPTRKKFIEYVDDGEKFEKSAEKWFKSHNKHWRVIQTWHKGYAMSMMRPETFKICFG